MDNITNALRELVRAEQALGQARRDMEDSLGAGASQDSMLAANIYAGKLADAGDWRDIGKAEAVKLVKLIEGDDHGRI